MERLWAILALVGLVGLSLVKGYLGVDDATTVLISALSGALIGYYLGSPEPVA